ncbi:MAG TPA: YbhB/YbcL family Raf kinase inhibitor-like protein [Dehalococcoidales bacterium]|nr:YbhB/YbcL family Raf kinase inhibitor-like protein [Dehalococcoidales bacterium]
MKTQYAGSAYITRQVALWLTLLSLMALLLVACGPEAPVAPKEVEMALYVSSTAFQEGESIPAQYSCQGQDISPPLAWSEPPSGTRSFALIVYDPDAPVGVFTHWVLFNLPADSRELPEAVPTKPQLANGALQGKNDFDKIGYRGPCPPPGSPHRYRFTLYSLDQALDLKSGATRKQVLEVMSGHVLAQGQLTGTYQR